MQVTDDGVPATALISAVKDAVRQSGISRASDERDLQVASVQLTLHVVATETAGGSLSFRVPVIGMKLLAGTSVVRQNTHTIDMTLTPPPEPGYQVRGGDVADVLADAITTIRSTLATAAAGDDPWLLEHSTIEISFGVTKTGQISLGIDSELSSEHTQKLRLTLMQAASAPRGRSEAQTAAAAAPQGRNRAR
jgi:hypothetical protein